jgi:hypothetical protein
MPKRGKIYQIATTLLNGHKIHQMAIKYANSSLKNLPKVGFFGFQNIPSGNPECWYLETELEVRQFGAQKTGVFARVADFS